jgi:iron(III) transport system substrate-binding protein
MLGIVMLGVSVLGPPPASAQGRVNILCSPDPAWCEAVKASFGKATGIQTEFVRLSSGAALARFARRRTAPAFDVWFGGSGDSQWVAQAEGLTEFLKPRRGGALAAADEGGGRSLHSALIRAPRARGQRETPQEKNLPVPETWKDLGDPKYKGLIAMPNPNTSGTGYL